MQTQHYTVKDVANMLKSMTGFGRYEMEDEERRITVEIKSVNHRYCDITIKMPKKLGFFEAGIRSLLKTYIGRGKVDVYITYEDYTEKKACVKYNEQIASEYMACFQKMRDRFQLEDDIKVSSLARFPEVFTLEEQDMDEKEIWGALSEGIKEAAGRFVETRVAEGIHLKEDISQKLDSMIKLVGLIELREPDIVKEYKEKLMAKVNELLQDTKIDEGVLAAELTVYADKICVDEETVRLKSHIKTMKAALKEGENIGRKLDFIAQEMNREANTILSKANDLEVSNWAIDLKTEIEKVREQIQNIE